MDKSPVIVYFLFYDKQNLAGSNKTIIYNSRFIKCRWITKHRDINMYSYNQDYGNEHGQVGSQALPNRGRQNAK